MPQKQIHIYIENEINRLSQRIIDKGPAADEVSYVQLGFQLALQRVIHGNPQPSDLGLLNTIEDTFKAMKIFGPSKDILAYFNDNPECSLTESQQAVEASETSGAACDSQDCI